MKFECASSAAEVLGCDPEELTTAVFKHHLKQILAQVTAQGPRQPPAEESLAGTGVPHPLFPLFMGEREVLCAAPDAEQGEDGAVLQGGAIRPFLFRPWGLFWYILMNSIITCALSGAALSSTAEPAGRSAETR